MTITKNVIEILEDYPECSDFVRMVDELGMRQLLGEGALYTVFAPTNKFVQEFLAINPSEQEKRNYVNGCFVNGIYYEYDIRKIYLNAVKENQTGRAEHLLFRTRTEGNFEGRYVKIFTHDFFSTQSQDFTELYGFEGNDYMIEDVAVSPDKRDISAANGVVNILEGRSPVRINLEQALGLDPDLSIVKSWFNTFRNLGNRGASPDPNVIIDTTTVITYTFPNNRNIASEGTITMLLVPTNKAIENYYNSYYPDITKIPNLIQGQQLATFTFSRLYLDKGLKDVTNKDFQSVSGTFVKSFLSNISDHIVGVISASNGIIYKMDEIIPATLVSSLIGGIYFLADEKEWHNWLYLMDNSNIENAMYDPVNGLHSPMTLLLRPDNQWPVPADEGDLTKHVNSATMGQILIDIRKDGGFKHRFYRTPLGDILFDPSIGSFGGFTSWSKDTVKLLSSEASYKNDQGQIFEVTGELIPLIQANDNHPEFKPSVWSVIAGTPSYSKFARLCSMSGLDVDLQIIGFTYTVFVPANEAIPLDPETCTKEEAKEFVREHITNFKVYSDGVESLVINQNDRQLEVNGSWESWKIKDIKGVDHTCYLPHSNIQTMNGLVHEITSAFTY